MDPTQRFSSRVADYAAYRPRYPRALLGALSETTGLDGTWVVADVGSGTGFSSDLFLDNGNPVFAVEPNAAMRAVAEARLRGRHGFTSLPGSAESTGLPAGAVDIVAAGQSFHWFDPAGARAEFRRILREPEWVALFWNARHTEASDFLRGYEALLIEFGTDYAKVRHERVNDTVGAFFGGPYTRRALPSQQVFDYRGLRGRLLSSSYTPEPGHPDHQTMLDALRSLFDRHQVEGVVRMTYDTEVLVGRLR